jgi:crossover junction endodeoxyribonuclease RuvC
MRPNYNNVIVGLDPGLITTGWGLIHREGSRLTAIASGSIVPNKKSPLGEKLLFIETNLDEMLKEFRPQLGGVEKAFAGASIESAFLLGSARSACLTALARARVEVVEFAPTHIKKSITGRGRADKQQMSYMVKTLLPTSQCQNDHEADALAIALTAGWQSKTLKEAV